MSMELPKARSGSKRMGAAEAATRTVAGWLAGADNRDCGMAARAAAALAVPRNLRRETREFSIMPTTLEISYSNDSLCLLEGERQVSSFMAPGAKARILLVLGGTAEAVP